MLKIRKMAPADLPQIVPLAAQLGYASRLEELTPRFLALSEDPGTGLFVGELDCVVAFMQLQETSTLMTGPRAELNAVVIDEPLRGQGFGRQMMDAAEAWVRERGLPKLRLGSRTSRVDTHEFYKKYGFAIEKEWYVFSKSICPG